MLFREWFAVICILCFMVTLFLVEEFSSQTTYSLKAKLSPVPGKIQVMVLGAVQRPGMYEVEVGSSIEALVGLAGLKKTADRGALYLKKRVFRPCSVTVPEKKCRKSRKKKQGSRSIAGTSYASEDSRNPFKMPHASDSLSVSWNF